MTQIFPLKSRKQLNAFSFMFICGLGMAGLTTVNANKLMASSSVHAPKTETIKVKNIWSVQNTFMTSLGVRTQIQDEVNLLTDSLISSVSSEQVTRVTRSGNSLKISIETNHSGTDALIYGMVADSSHFPYDFYWQSQNGAWSYELEVTGKNQTDLKMSGQLKAKYFAGRDPGNKKAKKKLEDNFHKQFSFFIRTTHKSAIAQGLKNASRDPEIQFDQIHFFTPKDSEDSEVLVNATNMLRSDRREAKDLLLEKLPYLNYARSAVSFGCMVLHNEFPYEIPSASATLINRLFAPVYENGKGDDGRTFWSQKN